MERVGGALPTWSFRVDDLPVGPYRVQLLPFLKVMMIDLPASGRDDVELVVPELAEGIVETIDALTGERVPLEAFYYRRKEPIPQQVQNDWARAHTEEPGRFRFWTAPGAVAVWPRFQEKLGYGRTWLDLDLVPGPQSVHFKLNPVHAIRIEFLDGGTEIDRFDEIWGEMQRKENFRAVDHEGKLTDLSLMKEQLVQVNMPGSYEISFEGVGADRFLPIPPRRVEVLPGETTEVVVELRRK